MIKSYTDLEQSKKLAEILPLESVDMCYLSEESLFPKVNYNGMVFFNSEEEKSSTIIPCWSLAALLGVLQYPTLFQNGDEEWGCTVWIDTTIPYSISPKDNPVDACYEIIIRLNELKML